mmetsp:Transcript_14032/g.47492  ORF Transcript_14032/g.47492 Transcript_14032/m.47492 type:complete len:256 (-) Transcript_14032:72-839(-)
MVPAHALPGARGPRGRGARRLRPARPVPRLPPRLLHPLPPHVARLRTLYELSAAVGARRRLREGSAPGPLRGGRGGGDPVPGVHRGGDAKVPGLPRGGGEKWRMVCGARARRPSRGVAWRLTWRPARSPQQPHDLRQVPPRVVLALPRGLHGGPLCPWRLPPVLERLFCRDGRGPGGPRAHAVAGGRGRGGQVAKARPGWACSTPNCPLRPLRASQCKSSRELSRALSVSSALGGAERRPARAHYEYALASSSLS